MQFLEKVKNVDYLCRIIKIRDIPTLFEILGYRFFFYANDHLPIHIHVEKAGGKAVFQIEPDVKLLKSKNFKSKELVVAEEKKAEIIAKWNEFFKSQENEN